MIDNKKKKKNKVIDRNITPDTPIVLEIKHLTKKYKIFKNDLERAKGLLLGKKYKREKLSLEDINLVVRETESVAILGRNGAGKSTLSKIITGVTLPTSGKVLCYKKVTALLELTAGFDPIYTGRENIYLKGMIMGIPKLRIDKYIDKIIEFADIGDFIDVQYKKYSSGMGARLGFAFNMYMEPEILIVDEALSVGDENFSKKCLARVKEIIEKDKVTFIFVTHSMVMAKEFCKRGIVIHNSKIIFDGFIDDAIKTYHKINA